MTGDEPVGLEGRDAGTAGIEDPEERSPTVHCDGLAAVLGSPGTRP